MVNEKNSLIVFNFFCSFSPTITVRVHEIILKKETQQIRSLRFFLDFLPKIHTKINKKERQLIGDVRVFFKSIFLCDWLE